MNDIVTAVAVLVPVVTACLVVLLWAAHRWGAKR